MESKRVQDELCRFQATLDRLSGLVRQAHDAVKELGDFENYLEVRASGRVCVCENCLKVRGCLRARKPVVCACACMRGNRPGIFYLFIYLFFKLFRALMVANIGYTTSKGLKKTKPRDYPGVKVQGECLSLFFIILYDYFANGILVLKC